MQHLVERLHLHAGRVHVERHAGEAPVVAGLAAGAPEQRAPLRPEGPARPDLLAVHDDATVAALGAAPHARVVGAGVGPRAALPPDLASLQHPGEETALMPPL